MFGLVTNPRRTRRRGRRRTVRRAGASPRARPARPVPASWAGSRRAARSRDVAQWVQGRLTSPVRRAAGRSTTWLDDLSALAAQPGLDERGADPPAPRRAARRSDCARTTTKTATRSRARPVGHQRLALRADDRGRARPAPCAESRRARAARVAAVTGAPLAPRCGAPRTPTTSTCTASAHGRCRTACGPERRGRPRSAD